MTGLYAAFAHKKGIPPGGGLLVSFAPWTESGLVDAGAGFGAAGLRIPALPRRGALAEREGVLWIAMRAVALGVLRTGQLRDPGRLSAADGIGDKAAFAGTSERGGKGRPPPLRTPQAPQIGKPIKMPPVTGIIAPGGGGQYPGARKRALERPEVVSPGLHFIQDIFP